MWMPRGLYESLPAVYAAVGVGGMVVTNAHPIAVASAVVLLACAGWVHLMRREQRNFFGDTEPLDSRRARAKPRP